MVYKINAINVLRRIHPFFLILLLLIIFFGKKLFPIDGNFIGFNDTELHFWNLLYIREQLLSGNVPLWNPYYYCGQPFLANPVNAVFYPSTLLFLAFPMAWAFNIDMLLHLLIAAMGMYYFVFLLTGSKKAGITASIIYCLNGYFLLRIFVGHLNLYHAAAIIPWIFLFAEKFIQTDRILYILITGSLIGFQVLSGDAQTCFYTSLSLTVYYFARYLLSPMLITPKRLFRYGYLFAIIPVMAICIGAVQMFPAMEFIQKSQRSGGTFEYATFASFPPENFFTFLVSYARSASLPFSFEFSSYTGIFSLLLAGIGGLFSKHRIFKICFIIILFVAITIILGHYTPFYQIYYKIIPGISYFRIPARCLVIITFCLSIFSGFGVQHISESSLTKKQNYFLIGCSVVILIVLFSGVEIFNLTFSAKEILIALGLTVTAIIFFYSIRFTKNQNLISVILIFFVFTDLYLAYANRIPTLNQNRILEERPYEKFLKKTQGYDRIMIPDIQHSTSRGSHFKYFQANGNASIVTGDLYRFIHQMADIPISQFTTFSLNNDLFCQENLFSSKILGIKYGFTLNKNGNFQLLSTSKVMPRVSLIKNAVVIPNFSEQLSYIKTKNFDPQMQVVLQEDIHKTVRIDQTTTNNPTRNIAEIISYRPHEIKLKAYTDSHIYLVLNELFYPGWHAYVNGEEVSIIRANYLLRAIPLQPGHHNIVFIFRQRSFAIGAVISIFTMVLVMGVGIYSLKKKDNV